MTTDVFLRSFSDWTTDNFIYVLGELSPRTSKPLGEPFSKFYLRLRDQKTLWKMKRIVKFFNLTKTEFPTNITVNGIPLQQLYNQALDEIKILELLEGSEELKTPEKNEDQETLLQTQAMTSDKLNFMAKRMEEQYNMITELVKSLQKFQ